MKEKLVIDDPLYEEFVRYIHFNHPDPDSIVMSMDKWLWLYKALKCKGAVSGGVLYRQHKGSLKHSMKTLLVVTNKKNLIEIISQQMEQPCVDVEIKPYGYDERTGWNTYIVLAKFQSHKLLFDTDKAVPVGYTNDMID